MLKLFNENIVAKSVKLLILLLHNIAYNVVKKNKYG